ncbi:substrate-binding domain-containing protein [Nonomuraea endophytica]|uniref:substrate-binding domain-containing protein n=1 Tax=Nonomuraea endophytica TaxID=714136 RepID=UPI0037C5100D
MALRRHMMTIAAALCLLGLVAAAPAHGTAAPPVSGSGSTFAAPAIDQWIVDAGSKLGLAVSFNANGSTAGRSQFQQKLVDFASSDVSYGFPDGKAAEAKPADAFTYMPLVAGGTALLYNLKDNANRPITDLQLTGPLVMTMYYQTWKTNGGFFWDDAAIKAENPHLAARLPHKPVRVVTRKGGSGTTAVFTEFLSKQSPQQWDEYARANPPVPCYASPCTPTSDWPDGRSNEAKSDSAGLADFVASTDASIGYAEYAYALQRALAVARIKNVKGNYVLPTACNQAIALTNAERNPDGTYNLDRVYSHDHPSAYPISSYNYVIVPAGGSDPAKGETMAKFVLYSITDGQKLAADIGYSPLPSNLIKQGFEALNDVPGHPAIPSDPDQWGKYYESLKLPDGTNCGQAGETGKGGGGVDGGDGVGGNEDNNQNNGNNNNNGNQDNNQNQNENQNNNQPKDPGNTPKTPTDPTKSTGTPTKGPNSTKGPTSQASTGPTTQGPTEGPGGQPQTTSGQPTTAGADPTLIGSQDPSQSAATTATANGLIDPLLAADAAQGVDDTAQKAPTPWPLYVVALFIIIGVFVPPLLLRLIRKPRS